MMTNSACKISVIVPVYNAKKYLHRCVDSILSQTFKDFELLLIDDGSTDGSGDICDNYATNDNRIKVFHKPNEGVSATRNFGIGHANGMYIQFVDGDDWIEPNMFEQMLAHVENTNADIVGCNFFIDFDYCRNEISCYHEHEEDFVREVISDYWGVVWKILVKKDLYIDNSIRFPSGINGGEDYVVCVKLSVSANRICCINKPLYHYNRSANNNSIMSSYSRRKVQDQINATLEIEDFLVNHRIKDKYKEELNTRKFNAKYPLLKNSVGEWLRIFPECNYLYRKLLTSRKSKLFVSLLLLLNALDFKK